MSCNSREYWMAADCPNCGEKDEPHAWKGARMSSTAWGHNYSCCSEKCGREFLNSKKHKAMEKSRVELQIEALKSQLKALSA